jgi:2-polyprenyl-6-hydroxyphenyl methylase/3-demethylubiquinone-9 3-methyltransferase
VEQVIRAYDSLIVKSYCRARFRILHQRFLEEIGQYLPEEGRVLDIGCGFGLFSLYYAMSRPGLRIHGIDINPRRIAMARKAASRLGLTNVEYEVENATHLASGPAIDAAYMLDIVHHVPRETVPAMIAVLYTELEPGGRLIIKDIDTSPSYKRRFTYVLDKLMDLRSPVHYWDRQTLAALLRGHGFEVYCHSMVDLFPYPHMLYICRKQAKQ